MNVCLISREYPPFFGGGIGTYNIQWARALAAAGHQVLVVTVSGDGTTQRETAQGAAGGRITVVRLPFINGNNWSGPHHNIATPEVLAAFHGLPPVAAFAMQIERAIPALAREFKLDIIEVPDTGALAWFGLNNRRTGGSWRDCPPIVTTIHSPSAWIAHYNRQPFASRADHELAAMERDSALWSDALISPSAALAQWTKQHWEVPADSIETIPYPLGDLESAATHAHDRTGDPFRLLFIGRLEPRKGIDTLLDSIARTNGLNLSVDLIGEDTPDPSGKGLFGQNSLRNLIPESKRNRVRLLGRKSPAELPALRDAADAIVIPSPMDNFPYVCVEAMAEGRFVIASSEGGTGEMIRDGIDGLLFPAGDAAACADILTKAVATSPPARRALRESAARRIRDYCGNQNILDRRLDHYRRTIDRARTRITQPTTVPVVIINRGKASDAAIHQLTAALRTSGADFAHSWPRSDCEVFAFSTPTLRTLSMSPRALGPLAVTQKALETPGVRDLLTRSPSGITTDSTWALAVALCAAGHRGVCSHNTIIDIPFSDHHPADRPLVYELECIHASRGWRLLNRIYDALHILRGRGLRRPYNRGRRRP